MIRIFSVIKTIVVNWTKNANSREAACIAFFTIFSLAPMLVVGVFIAGQILGETGAKEQIIAQVHDLVGAQGAEAVATVIENSASISHGLLASSVSIFILLYGASRVFSEMRYALNKIFGVTKVQRSTKKHVISYVRGRLLGFALVLSLGFFVLVSLTLSALLQGFKSWLLLETHLPLNLLSSFNIVFTILSVGIVFAILLKFLPEKRLQWRYIIPAALFSAILFSVGKDLVGAYLGHSSVSSAYGAAGSAIVFLVWVYFTSLTLLLGAEIANAFSKH